MPAREKGRTERAESPPTCFFPWKRVPGYGVYVTESLGGGKWKVGKVKRWYESEKFNKNEIPGVMDPSLQSYMTTQNVLLSESILTKLPF